MPAPLLIGDGDTAWLGPVAGPLQYSVFWFTNTNILKVISNFFLSQSLNKCSTSAFETMHFYLTLCSSAPVQGGLKNITVAGSASPFHSHSILSKQSLMPFPLYSYNHCYQCCGVSTWSWSDSRIIPLFEPWNELK